LGNAEDLELGLQVLELSLRGFRACHLSGQVRRGPPSPNRRRLPARQRRSLRVLVALHFVTRLLHLSPFSLWTGYGTGRVGRTWLAAVSFEERPTDWGLVDEIARGRWRDAADGIVRAEKEGPVHAVRD